MIIKEGYKGTEIGIIPEDWEVINVDGAISFLKSGLSRKLCNTNVGIPCLRSSNIIDGKLKLDDLKYWYKEDPQGANVNDYILEDGDILVNFINSIAQIGKACIFDKIDFKAIYTTNIFRVKTDPQKIDNRFFLYNTQTKLYSGQISLITKPAVNQASFTTGDFKNIKIPCPSISEQQQIAEILYATDAYIEKLDKIIEDYQHLKKGMMRKLLTEGIGHTEFKETEIGRIPKEWEVKSLDECFNIITTSIKPYEDDEKMFTHYSIPAFDINQKPIMELGKSIKSNKYKVSSNTILVSKLNPRTLRVWNIKKVAENAICSTEFINYHKFCEGDQDYFYHVLSSDVFQKELLNLEAGSTGSRKRVTPSDTYYIQIPVPSISEQISIGEFMNDITNRIQLVEEERSAFTELKKSLVEKLLTGKVRLKKWGMEISNMIS